MDENKNTNEQKEENNTEKNEQKEKKQDVEKAQNHNTVEEKEGKVEQKEKKETQEEKNAGKLKESDDFSEDNSSKSSESKSKESRKGEETSDKENTEESKDSNDSLETNSIEESKETSAQLSVEMSVGAITSTVDDSYEREDQSSNGQKEKDLIKLKKTELKQKVESKGKIDHQYIIQNVDALNYYVENHLPEDDSKNINFVDPTSDLPSRPSNVPQFNSPKELQTNFKILKEEHILIVSSLDEKLLLSATYALIDMPEMKNYQRRRFLLKEAKEEQVEFLLGMFTNKKIGRGESLIVVIDIKLQRFLDSLFADLLYVEGIKESLKKNNIFLICIVNAELLTNNLINKFTVSNLCYWEIYFLRHLLCQHFDGSRAENLEKKILELRGYGLWGEYNNDIEFHEHISSYLRAGEEQFEQLVETSYKNSKEMSRIEFQESINSVKVSDLFKEDELINNIVLYVATFFPDLTPRNFDEIVLLLLKDEKGTIIVESQKVTKKGKIKIVKDIKEKELINIWKDKSDKILKECCLKSVESENTSKVIDFTRPYLRKEMKKYLEQERPMFLQHQFEVIQNSWLLFDPYVSSKITENVIKLSVEMTLSDPQYYGSEWLMSFVVGIKRQSNIDIASGKNFEDFLITQLLARIEEERLRRYFFARLSDLIREMLNHKELRDLIKNFLEILIETRHHDAVLEIVLEVAKRLRDTEEFDFLYWIKRLLDQGLEKIKVATYRALYNHAKQSGARIYQIIDKIKTWLPEKDREFNRYSPSNYYSLRFIMDYCSTSVLDYKQENYGDWPSTYPLFIIIHENKNSFKTRLKELIEWIFHPGLKNILDDSFENKEVIINTLLADLIEAWVTILQGFDEEDINPETLNIVDMLLHQISIIINRDQQRTLQERWRLRRQVYLNLMSQMNVQQRAQRAVLKVRRKILIKIENRCKLLNQRVI